MPHSLSLSFGAAVSFACLSLCGTPRAQVPVDTPYLSGYAVPVGFAYHGLDLLFLYERRGTVRVIDHGTPVPGDLLNIREEVGYWRDFGMLGFALDPDFANNGYYYVSYVVDRHHLLHFGTPSYSATTDEYFAATQVRVTRFTADVNTGFTTTVPGSRFVLLGEAPGTGPVITGETHGSGQLAFGSDGTLLVGAGDGGSAQYPPDCGSTPATYYLQALADGLMRPEENVGAFRSQMVDSFSGKILRLDRATGDGVPSNPFYDPAHARSARSRVWALGLRQPFRMCVRPGTGSADPSLGEPGSIYVGDVGWYTREELDVVHHGGDNFGWPLFEGIEPTPYFSQCIVDDMDAPNPLAGSGGCNQTWFHFDELLQQAEDTHTQFFPNPCNPALGIAASTPTFVHEPPVLDWLHGVDDARVPVFENGLLVARRLGTPAAGVPGPQFHGSCAVGGCWHSGLTFPLSFGPCYYLGDFDGDWILRLEFDDEDHLLAVHDFAFASEPLMIGECPVDHSLIYVGYHDQLHKLTYGIEPPPTAVPFADLGYGGGNFDVQLDARGSYDPQGQPLTYFWNLGNGRTSTSPQLGLPIHGPGSPSTHQVALTVTDPYGATDTATLDIAVDNTPPKVEITSFANGDTFSLSAPTVLPLVADVVDAEHGPSQLSYVWRTTLRHEHHVHPEPPDPSPTSSTTLSPTPVGHDFYAYTVELEVTDAGGLSTSITNWLFPDSSGASTSVLMTSPAIGDKIAYGTPVEFQALTTGSVQRVEYYVDGDLIGVASTPPYAITWAPTANGPLTASALAIGTDDTSSNTGGIRFTVETPTVTLVRGKGPWCDANETFHTVSAPIATGTALVLGDDGTAWLAGLQFDVPSMPIGARVQNATIDFRAAQTDIGSTRLQIACDASAAPGPIANQAGNLRSRKTAPGRVAWQPSDWLAGDSGPPQRTPDLTNLLQPLVDAAKWNRSLVFLIRGSGTRHAVAWNGDPLVGPLLSIAWLPPLPPQQVLPIQDDGTEFVPVGTVDLAAATLHLGEHLGVEHATALEFTLPLTGTEVIESAHLQFTSAGADSGPAVLTIAIEDADDAAPLMSSAFDITSRMKLAQTVTWYPPEWPTAGAAGTAQRSADIAPLVQMVLARPGWQPNGKILLVVEGTGSRTAAALDAGANQAVQLVVDYRLP